VGQAGSLCVYTGTWQQACGLYKQKTNYMAKSTVDTAWLRKLELYEKLVATRQSVERKGATVPYTSHNGHMFSYLSKDGKLALRLPAEARAAFLKKYKADCAKRMAWFKHG